MKRREFIAGLGGAAVGWVLTARAQNPALPVIGFLGSATAKGGYQNRLSGFRRGLNEGGYVEGRNVLIDFRWAENQYDRLPALAVDFVQHRVAVIVAAGAINAALAAKAATTTIPIVFAVGSNPVQLGLVSSLARPEGNVTGITTLNRDLMAKHLEILHDLLPNVSAFGLLVNPHNPNSDSIVRELKQVSDSQGWVLHVVDVNTEAELDTAIATLVQVGTGAFMHATDAIFSSSFERMVALASRYRIPGIYSGRDAVESGGLMSYGGRTTDEYRLLGQYTARILKGERPGDLPVQQATRVEFVINLKTARALGLSIPPALLVRADEVIE
jgi:putative ABC transport system substrate-binding protein